MIITCPKCGSMYNLKSKPSKTFHCHKCGCSAPFTEVIKNSEDRSWQRVTNAEDNQSVGASSAGVDPLYSPSPDNEVASAVIGASSQGLSAQGMSAQGGETRVVPGLGGGETRVVPGLGGDKTRVAPGLQGATAGGATLRVVYRGVNCGNIRLPKGNFTLGRKSSDSTAQVQLSPDRSMSRVHAGMRSGRLPNGVTVYQITTIKDTNPVVVNGKPIAKGKPCTLKNGDKIRMGETDMTYIV